MHDYKEAAGIEGPYWDYSAVQQWAREETNSSARLCAKYLQAGDPIYAEHWAGEYAKDEARERRIRARYDSVAAGPAAVRWIGWDRL